MTLTFSRRLALVFGILLPIVETHGAWRTAKDIETGRPWLAAA